VKHTAWQPCVDCAGVRGMTVPRSRKVTNKPSPFSHEAKKAQLSIRLFQPFFSPRTDSYQWLLDFFSPYNIPKNWEKYTKVQQNIPNHNKIYQITTKYTKEKHNDTESQQNIPNHNKIYQMTAKYTKSQQKIYQT
jgi:hypothetical protein